MRALLLRLGRLLLGRSRLLLPERDIDVREEDDVGGEHGEEGGVLCVAWVSAVNEEVSVGMVQCRAVHLAVKQQELAELSDNHEPADEHTHRQRDTGHFQSTPTRAQWRSGGRK